MNLFKKRILKWSSSSFMNSEEDGSIWKAVVPHFRGGASGVTPGLLEAMAVGGGGGSEKAPPGASVLEGHPEPRW